MQASNRNQESRTFLFHNSIQQTMYQKFNIFYFLKRECEWSKKLTILTDGNLSYTSNKTSYWITENFCLQISLQIQDRPKNQVNKNILLRSAWNYTEFKANKYRKAMESK